MSIFKTKGVVLKTGKFSDSEMYYKIFFKEYGVLTVKKKKKVREKPIDIGYHISCEIITHGEKKVHTIGNIKVISYFLSENKKYSEIEGFLIILSTIYREIPEGSPHYSIYQVLDLFLSLNEISGDITLLTHLKIVSLLGNLSETHNDTITQKTLAFVHKYNYKDILRLGSIPVETKKHLEKMI